MVGCVIAGAFALGVGIGHGALDRLAVLGLRIFDAIAESHYVLYQARENLTADGAMEFAVLVGSGDVRRLAAFVDQHPGWRLRESLIPGWHVVSVPGDRTDALERLRASGVARAVLRNRGMWLCH